MQDSLNLKIFVLILAGFFHLSTGASVRSAEKKNAIKVFWLHLEDDPEWQEQRAYTGLKLKQRYPALRGITVGLLENKVKLRSKKATFDFTEISVRDALQ